jgi:Ca2+-dependent lipid-binding protein
MLFLTIGIYRHLNITYPFIKVSIGAFLISLFISLAVTIFKLEKGLSWLNAIIGFIVATPSLFVLRYLFGYSIFRYSFVFYLFIIVVAIIYGIAIMVVSRKAKSEANELNLLLPKEKEDK